MKRQDAGQGDQPVQLKLSLGPPIDPEVLRMRELRDRALAGWAILRRKLGKSLH
jgi:hypothetical protein